MKRKTTEELNNEIKRTSDIRDYLKRNKEHMLTLSLSEHLNMLLHQKNLKKADVVRSSQLGRIYLYKIFSGEKIPSRDKLIAIACGLDLSEAETQNLLKLSGNRELYARDKRDALILFGIQRNKSVIDINEMLDEQGLSILNTTKE